MWSWKDCYLIPWATYFTVTLSYYPTLNSRDENSYLSECAPLGWMGIGVDSQVQMKSGCEKMFLPSLKTSAFFSIDVIRWYYVIDHISIKVRKYQKQIILFSHPQKNEQNICLILPCQVRISLISHSE